MTVSHLRDRNMPYVLRGSTASSPRRTSNSFFPWTKRTRDVIDACEHILIVCIYTYIHSSYVHTSTRNTCLPSSSTKPLSDSLRFRIANSLSTKVVLAGVPLLTPCHALWVPWTCCALSGRIFCTSNCCTFRWNLFLKRHKYLMRNNFD